ncbi:MAG TPA: 50S ribosomal protein L3 N(5)-glutamine methyltransferase [Burkholderiales bacterium]|nr:50S ribosomal protein L3 N(5)-glutamine methyltransferase [Burkholderiales bacterium]
MFAEAAGHLRTVRDWLRFAVSRFGAANLSYGQGSTNAYDEAAYLILHTLHLPLDRLEPFLDAALTPQEAQAVAKVLQRRVDERLPAAYLTNEAWLGDLSFYVDPRAIVPRSYIAELLPEGLEPWVGEAGVVDRALDLCTGSGCLAVLLALAYPEAQIDATELSADTLEVAKRNVADYALGERVRLHRGDLFAGLRGPYRLIISNPPYVNAESMAQLPAEFRAEPEAALAAGEDGLDIVRRILAEAGPMLSKDGVLVVEIGHNREALELAYPDLPFTWLETSGGEGFVFLLNAVDLKGVNSKSANSKGVNSKAAKK